jgi:hypothetical protein
VTGGYGTAVIRASICTEFPNSSAFCAKEGDTLRLSDVYAVVGYCLPDPGSLRRIPAPLRSVGRSDATQGCFWPSIASTKPIARTRCVTFPFETSGSRMATPIQTAPESPWVIARLGGDHDRGSFDRGHAALRTANVLRLDAARQSGTSRTLDYASIIRSGSRVQLHQFGTVRAEARVAERLLERCFGERLGHIAF